MASDCKISFVLLAFRNSDDVDACLTSIERLLGPSLYNAAVVDSYYSEEDSSHIKMVALSHGADYIPVDNKGYGYGNNVGVAHFLNEASQDFIAICNPDTELKAIDNTVLTSLVASFGNPHENPYIIAPRIKTINGKDQNPLVSSKSELSEFLVYKGYITRNRLITLVGFALNRVKREMFLFTHLRKNHSRIYAPHGSFVLFSNKAAELLNPLFDEQIFLFAEEYILAWNASQSEIPIYFCPMIKVRHKEDGSVGLLNETYELMRESNIYVYEKTHELPLNNYRKGEK